MTPTPDRIARLPKWARDYIEAFERELAEAKRVAEPARRATPSKVIVGPYGDKPDHYLPDNSRVRFALDEHDPWRAHFDVKLTDDGIELHASAAISIDPIVANHLTVRLRP